MNTQLLLARLWAPMLGLGAISFVAAFSLSGSQDLRLSSVEVRAEGQLDAMLMPLLVSNDPGIRPDPYFLTMSARPDVPGQLRAGEGFPVQVTFDVSAHQSGAEIAADSFAMRSIRRELAQSLTASLDVAGLTVEPRGFTPVDGTLSAAWSVRSSAGGSYVGILKAVLNRPVTFSTTQADLPGNLRLTLEVKDPPRTLKDMAVLALTWAGGLSTAVGLIVGIFTLVDRRRKQKEEQAKKDKPRIYTPDGTQLGG